MPHQPVPFSTSAPPTPLMGATELSWVDIEEQARHVLHLLQTEGETALNVVTGILKLIRAVSERDMIGVFAAINDVNRDVTQIVNAIRAEFGI